VKKFPLVFSGLIVSVGDRDYEEVYAFEGCVPYLYKDLWMINPQWTADTKYYNVT